MQPVVALYVGFICSIFMAASGIRLSSLQGLVLMAVLLAMSELWQRKQTN